MNRLIIFISCCLFVSVGFAIPARRVSKVVRQADGTELTLFLQGDETFHYYTTADGTPFREGRDGFWALDNRDVRALHNQALQRRNTSRQQLAKRMRRVMKSRQAPFLTDEVITRRGLLILVNFADLSMINGDDSRILFNQMLNAIDDPYCRNHGSIREYFRDQSYNQFDIEFDVVGPVTVSGNMSYYGANDDDDYDKHPGEMIKEACRLVNDQVNFKNYDWDGDGEVENIYVIYAGYSEANGAPANTIWPHQWDLASATGTNLILDGTVISTYACGSELYGKSGKTLDGIGTMCHEYSHCLGLPDFYDCDGQTGGTGFGMAVWSLMDYGCYNYDGFCPCGYTAYERWYCGWLEPVELNQPCNIVGLKDIERNPEAYIIYNDAHKSEYYMLANHQKVGWDSEADAHGMLIIHVDYNKSAWANNTVNDNATHQRMTYKAADGRYTFYDTRTDLWPNGNNTELTDSSTVMATLFNKNTDGQKLMHKPITEITETDSLISFVFMGGENTPVRSIAAPFSSDYSAYTLDGRPATNLRRGNMYILGGRKIFVR